MIEIIQREMNYGERILGAPATALDDPARYVIELDPLASDPVDRLVAAIGPTVQRHLTGDLD